MNQGKTYHTRQQEAILNYMAESGEQYVTVNQIAAHFQKTGQSVGLTTIYRQLDKLEKEGIVCKLVLDGNSGACYQYADKTAGRLLLKCEDCGDIIPMGCSHMEELYEHVLQEHQFQVNPHRTMFYGRCDACLEREEKISQGEEKPLGKGD